MQTDKNVLVSIIIPVYNVSKYLCRCLDSCVFQTLSDIEIILVNDCSPDPEDATIMEKYQADYPEKIRIKYHKENLGLGGARNTGIELAKGKYIIFVDSDDYIDVTMCQKCYECAESQNSDIVLTHFYICQIGGSIMLYKRNGNIKGKNSSNIYYAGAMLIKKKLIIQSDIFFPEKLFYEDTAVIPLLQAIAKKISVVDEPLYYYIKGCIGSITSLKFEARVESVFKAYELLLENTKLFPQYFNLMSFYFYDYFSRYLKEIDSLSIFKLFSSCFQDICLKYDLNIESLSMQKKQIFRLFLKASADSAWDEAYNEYLSLIRNRYLIYCSESELCEIFNNKNPETVCVWGCGNYGTQLLEKFEDLGFKCLVTDMNVNKIGNIMPNGSVVQPWNEVKNNIKTLIVSVAGKFEEISNLVDSDVEVFAVNG